MTIPTTLDAQQREAAEITPEVRQVVLASAGSGKTETVSALVAHLADQGVDAAQEVLVLSFSRAAVSAVKRRFAAQDLRGVSVRTLDGLAARIILSSEGGEEITSDFDQRIRQATKLLDSGEVTEELDAIVHVVVDEIQDVVGDRARFVLAILRAVRDHAGFTLLGDPQQAIYNFQLEGPADVTSPNFLRMIDSTYAPRLVPLEGEYRALEADARRVVELSRQISGLTGKARIDAIRSCVAEVLDLSDLDDLAKVLGRSSGTTAVLCVDNGTAMIVHDALRSRGVDASLQASAEQRGVAEWVAYYLPPGAPRIARAEFDAAWRDDEMSPAEAWRLLKRAERGFKSPKSIAIDRLSTAVALRDVPAELLEPPSSAVTVSTVHRSKGLEFDDVVLVNAGGWLPATCDDDDASVAYVAVSRARKRLFAVRVDIDRRLRKDTATDRWILGGYKSWQTFGFEIQPADTRVPTDPARAFESQQYLSRVRVGDEVLLKRDRASSEASPGYLLQHEGTTIGRTADWFGSLLRRRCKVGPPLALTGLRVGSFETRGCGPEMQNPKVATLWRAPVISGMANIEW